MQIDGWPCIRVDPPSIEALASISPRGRAAVELHILEELEIRETECEDGFVKYGRQGGSIKWT